MRLSSSAPATWIHLMMAMVMVMIVLGGVTRLTGSGLSMVAWEPISGVLPPLSDDAWMTEFARYQESPEFRQINSHMTIHDFKGIFWLEYAHRLWGRLLGIVMLVPLVFFTMMRRITFATAGRLTLIFALGAAQGGLGWLMVKSGLHDQPWVSPYRLVAHLLMGFALLALLYDQKLRFSSFNTRPLNKPQLSPSIALGLLAFATVLIALGGLVAGHKAGLVYNTFPQMGGQWIPDDLFTSAPWYMDLVAHPVMVQWVHRWLAILFVMTCWGLAFFQRQTSGLLLALAGAATAQAGLGITTLLLHVPVFWAAAHQAWAAVVVLILVKLLHSTRRTLSGVVR